MTLNTIIYTTSPARKIAKDLVYIRERLMLTKGREGVNFTVKHVRPPKKLTTLKDAEGHIRPDWTALASLYPSGEYNAVGFHFTRQERKHWGIEDTLGGSYDRSRTDSMLFWLCADPGVKAKRYNFSEFTRVTLHEIQHGDVQLTGARRELVHEADYLFNRIHELPADLSYVEWNKALARRDTLKKQLDDLKKNLILPISKKYFDRVSQHFLNPSTHYKSGVHNGTDFACPVGTPVAAPCDGEIIHRFVNHPSLGNAVHFSCNNGTYIRFLHLSQAMKKGKYKQGDTIGFTGNTGDSTGPHLHLDIWRVAINTALIKTKEGVAKHLINPIEFFKGAVG